MNSAIFTRVEFPIFLVKRISIIIITLIFSYSTIYACVSASKIADDLQTYRHLRIQTVALGIIAGGSFTTVIAELAAIALFVDSFDQMQQAEAVYNNDLANACCPTNNGGSWGSPGPGASSGF
jgi:hypothetical protein